MKRVAWILAVASACTAAIGIAPACNGLAGDNANSACANVSADSPGVSALTVMVDPVAVDGTASSKGACTDLACDVEADASSGCSEWKGKMTSSKPDASCVVTFVYSDGTGASATVHGGESCSFPSARLVLVHEHSLEVH